MVNTLCVAVAIMAAICALLWGLPVLWRAKARADRRRRRRALRAAETRDLVVTN